MTVRPSVVVGKRKRSLSRRWVVQAGDGRTLAAVVERLGDVGAAPREGRVFVNGRRMSDPAAAVAVGDLVEVSPRGGAPASIRLMDRRGGITVVHKPPGIPTEPDRSGTEASVVEQAARLLGTGSGSVHACSRLDIGVSGLVLVTTCSEAHRHIEDLRRRGALLKVYLGVSATAPKADRGVWSWQLERQGRLQRAITEFDVLSRTPDSLAWWGTSRRAVKPALLRLVPRTGRWHQLRLHTARAGVPLLGDRRHGGPERFCSKDGAVHRTSRVALDAARLELVDETGQPWVVRAECPPDVRELWLSLGGPAGALSAWSSPVELSSP